MRPSGPRPHLHLWRWLLLAGFVLLLLFIVATSTYRLAATRYAVEAERLRRDLAAAHESGRRLTERVAAAEQRMAVALSRTAAAEHDRDTRLPRGDAARLLGLVQERLDAGVPADRLAFVIGRTRVEPTCEPRLDTKRIQPRTPLATNALVTANFLDDKVTVAAQASTAPNPAPGQTAGFDVSKPVELRFTMIGGGIETAKGLLPLGHAFVLQGRELRFIARRSEKQPGMLDVSLQLCSFP
jgi:hypothetical protein